MSDHLTAALATLLETSLVQWDIAGRVHVESAAANHDRLPPHDRPVIRLTTADRALTVSRAPPAMPFRWIVEIDGRKRTAASVVGVLAITRQTVATGYTPLRLTIAPLPPQAAP